MMLVDLSLPYLFFIYFDYFIVYNKIEQYYVHYLRQVFLTFREQKLYNTLRKFVTLRVVFLQCIVFYDGIQVD